MQIIPQDLLSLILRDYYVDYFVTSSPPIEMGLPDLGKFGSRSITPLC